MIKLLIGGSPCTYWSIMQQSGKREVEAAGLGWELFKNYLIAKEKFQPDYFLYENNKSAAQAIKDQICTELNQELMYINSALVSAQNRQRFYVFNWDVEQPEDRHIYLKDILESGEDLTSNNKTFAITTGIFGSTPKDTITKHRHNMVAEPIRVGIMPNQDGSVCTGQANRIYGINAKSITLMANGGGKGAKTGLYAIPANNKNNYIYKVSNGEIEIKGEKYPIKLQDGYYIIRKLTVNECCRLQTMPDNYCKAVSNTQAYKGLGNGWTAEVIIHILDGVLKDVPRDEEIVVLSMYDGIGTGRYCLDKMGFTNIKYFAYEIDKYAMKIAVDNYPDIIQMGDAFRLRENDWHLDY